MDQLKYQQIKKIVIDRIESGEYQPGDKIPGESFWRNQYHVSATTVRKAFTELIKDGYCFSKIGSGTYVAHESMRRSSLRSSFSDELRERGYKVGLRDVKIRMIKNPEVAGILGLKANADIIHVCRVRTADDKPICYHDSYLSAEMIEISKVMEMMKEGSLANVLYKNLIRLARITAHFEFVTITDEEIANGMGVPIGYITIRETRETYDADGRMVELAYTYYERERFSYSLNYEP